MPLMIKSKEKGWLSCPVIICDVCGKEITKAEDGMYLYTDTKEETIKPHFVHKGLCDRRFDKERYQHKKYPDAPLYGSEELMNLCVYLGRNCIGMKEVEKCRYC